MLLSELGGCAAHTAHAHADEPFAAGGAPRAAHDLAPCQMDEELGDGGGGGDGGDGGDGGGDDGTAAAPGETTLSAVPIVGWSVADHAKLFAYVNEVRRAGRCVCPRSLALSRGQPAALSSSSTDGSGGR